MKWDYKPELLDYDFGNTMDLDSKTFLQPKEKPSTQEALPLVVTFNKTLSNVENIIDNNDI